VDTNTLSRLTPYELGISGSEEAIPHLIKYLEHGSVADKKLAASAVGKLSKSFKSGAKKCIPYLLKNLALSGPQMRQYTLKTLLNLPLSADAKPLLEKIACSDEKEYNQKAAKKILQKNNWKPYRANQQTDRVASADDLNIVQQKCIACNDMLMHPIFSIVGVLCDSCKSQGLFRKRLIITGITRMSEGHVCVSGIDYDTGKFVRPVFQAGLDRDFVMQGRDQVVQHFNIVEFEFKEYKPSPLYHTEDWVINEKFAPNYVGHAKDETVINILRDWSIGDLNEAIEKKNQSLFIVKSCRIESITDEFSYNKFKVRITFTDGSGFQFNRIPVTDLLILNFVRYQKEIGNHHYAGQMIKLFNSNPFRFIRVGLTREFQGQHWKQVTALMTVPDMFDGASFADYERKLGGQV
jgi:hypothetical protein